MYLGALPANLQTTLLSSWCGGPHATEEPLKAALTNAKGGWNYTSSAAVAAKTKGCKDYATLIVELCVGEGSKSKILQVTATYW